MKYKLSGTDASGVVVTVHAESLSACLLACLAMKLSTRVDAVQVPYIMVANSIPQGQVKAGDKVVNDVKLTDTPAERFNGQLRPYSQADVEKLRYSSRLLSAQHCLHV